MLLTLFEGKPVHGERAHSDGRAAGIASIRTAGGCRSSSTRPATASSCRCRSRGRTARRIAARRRRRAPNAKRLALGRRDFLLSTCGAASTLLAFNAANAAAGRTGGFFDLPAVAATEPAAAAPLETGEFIFDVQGHYVDPTEAWLKTAPRLGLHWRAEDGLRAERPPRRRAATSPA